MKRTITSTTQIAAGPGQQGEIFRVESLVGGAIGPLQLRSHDQIFFPEHFYIMGYNLKNTRNGKRASKIPKWLSLSLRVQCKFIRQFEVSDNL